MDANMDAVLKLIDNLKAILNMVNVSGLQNMQHLVMVAQGLDTIKKELQERDADGHDHSSERA